jgi:hypothetical protein
MLIGTDSTESEIVYLRSRIAVWSDAYNGERRL